MADEERFAFENNLFQQIPPSHPSTMNDQDEVIARKKLEQKRRFQQKQTNPATDVDSLMKSMFTDLKLQTKTNHSSDSKKTIAQVSELSVNPKVQQSVPTHTPIAPGAADWSKITFDDEFKTIFHQEDKSSNIPTETIESPPSTLAHHSIEQQVPPSFVYPHWCSQPINYLPLVYQQVFEASYQSNIIQTSILYPILLLSGLRQDQLSQIWSQVNLTQPGTLIKEELFMALALIALAQNNNGIICQNDQLYQLTDIPIPHFQIQQQQQPEPSDVPTPDSISHPPAIDLISVPPSEPTLPVPPSPPAPAPIYQQENFADFTSFDQIEDNIDLANNTDITQITTITLNNTNTDNDNNNGSLLLLDFDFNHLHPPEIQRNISSETQSLASLDLPIPTMMNQDNTSQITTSDNQSLNLSNHHENPFGHDTQSVHSTNSSEPSKLELTQFSFFSDDTSESDSNTSVWLRCFEKCHSIFSQANEIFSSIHSPNLCSEVLQNTRTRDYVHHLQEIFHVHKRIYTAAILNPTTNNQITSIWKQIIVLWTNLQSFFSTIHLHLLNDDDVDYSSLLSDETSSYCSICLLSTNGLETVLPSSNVFSFNTACLTFAGRLYHATCANFYLNLIDGILPSLRRSS